MTAYLLTDIEGSTRLWEESPDAMGPALARHDALLRAAFAAHRGRVVRTAGDAFTVAFDSVADAAQAALDAQRTLYAQAWRTSRPLRARMAIDLAESPDGTDGIRMARLLVRGHGGQTLLSEAARAALPEGETIGLEDGIAGLLGPGVPRDFPPLRPLFEAREVPHNLPASTTSFIGRDAELAAVAAALRQPGLLTLVGPGGTGKTRLALRAAARARRGFPGGVWLVELAALTDPALVASTLADLLHSTPDEIADRLKAEPTLLILDNGEHLVGAVRNLVESLLEAAPDLRILVTSREPLDLEAERTLRVPTLSIEESVRLFAERATAQRGDFSLTDANRPVVATLCARLDGIPLAVELAAARVRSLSPEQIEARLDDRFRLLTGGSRAALPRQQTLRALVEWSHDLLNDRERAVLRRLAVFAGGWTAEDAARIVADGDLSPEEVTRRLDSLVDRSLVVHEGERYGMLETLRQYALERLRESGEETHVGERHGAHFAALAVAEGPKTRDDADAMRRLTLQLDNLRAAMDRGTATRRLAMVGALRRFWVMRGMAREARSRALAALREDDPPSPNAHRVAAIATACAMGGWAGDAEELTALVREGIALAKRLGEAESHMTLLNELGSVLKYEGELPGARDAFAEAARVKPLFPPLGNLAIVQTLMGEYKDAERTLRQAEDVLEAEGGGSPYFRAYGASMRIRLLYAQGRFEEAETETDRLVAIAEEMGLAVMLQEAWSVRVDLCLARGRVEEAAALVRRTAEAVGGVDTLEPFQIQLAQVALARGDAALAVEPLRAALTAARPLYLPAALEAAARLLADTGQLRPAAVLLGAASRERARTSMPLMPIERAEHDRLVARLQEFGPERVEGASMPPDAARAFALAAIL